MYQQCIQISNEFYEDAVVLQLLVAVLRAGTVVPVCKSKTGYDSFKVHFSQLCLCEHTNSFMVGQI
jgi:hypothetical protein